MNEMDISKSSRAAFREMKSSIMRNNGGGGVLAMKNRSLHLCFKWKTSLNINNNKNSRQQRVEFISMSTITFPPLSHAVRSSFLNSEIFVDHCWQPYSLLPYPFCRAHKQFRIRTTSALHSWNNQPVSPEAILCIKNFLPIPVAFASQCRPTDLPPRRSQTRPRQSLIPFGDINFISKATDWTF